ncbi:MAG TPA: hypothetical protein VMU54_03065, partial [Planctomycetota bacterium]|nr:hypothetical protein [Planctomycetota bacterium]
QEIDRLLKTSVATGRSTTDTITGIRVHTLSRTVEGVLVQEEPDRLHIKTAASRTPVVVPKAAIVGRSDRVELPEADAYGAEERIERRMARLGSDDFEGTVEIAGLASRWGLYARAKELYRRAASIAPSRKDEVEALVGASDALARERQAADLLGDIGRSVQKADYARALELARTLLLAWSDTQAARQNPDLVSKLEAEAEVWKLRKSEILARRVPESYRQKLAERIVQVAHLERFPEVRTAVGELDSRIVQEIAGELKSTPEEIGAAWDRRERRVRTVGFGSGSWIILGGQDGGLDSDAKFLPVQRNLTKPPPEAIPLGLKLDTSSEWWGKAGTYERRDWIEAEFARTSSAVQKTLKERRCSRCLGEGTLPVSRRGIDCVAKCPRCHGAKIDQSAEYR